MKNKEDRKKRSPNIEIINILDSAFDEDIAEINEISDMETGEESAQSPGKKEKFYFVMGLFVLIMAAVGVISTVSLAVERIRRIADNTEQKNEFARLVYPVVICDPPAFSEGRRLKNETIISAAVWDIILFENKDKYSRDFDYLIVPEIDVEQHAARLFGQGLSLDHTTVAGADVSFYYDSGESSYRIPENPKYFTYSPYIENIRRDGDSFVITVGYVSPSPAWLTLTSEEAPQPDKYVEYTVKIDGSEYYIMSMNYPEGNNFRDNGL